MQRTIKIKTTLPYKPEQVWQALTDQKILGSWFMENDFVPELHHEFTFQMKPQRGWDGITHCEVIELNPLRSVAYTYRGKASGEKPLACAGINSEVADKALKGIFTELDTVLRFDIAPEGNYSTQLILTHSGFKGFKLVIVSFIMGAGWHKILKRLSATLDTLSKKVENVA